MRLENMKTKALETAAEQTTPTPATPMPEQKPQMAEGGLTENDDDTLGATEKEVADDIPAHLKSSILGSSISIPITDGRLNLGTWQGIYLCEHRNQGTARKIIATIEGKV